MKKLTLTLAAACAFCAMSYAGPEPLPSGKEMKQVAPPPAPECPNWTGFYIGGFGGYKFASVDQELTLGGSWGTERFTVQQRGSGDLDTSGGELGGLIGYNYQWHNWVFGAEAAGGYLWLRDFKETGVFPTVFDSYDIAASFKTHYLFTFGPRIGYALCRWMPYITGGLAVGDLEYFQKINDDTFQGLFHEGGSVSETNAGWMVGGGLEYALTNHWSLRGQYQYVDLGSVDFDSSGSVPFQAATGHHEASLREHNASFAIMYKF